MDTNTLQIVEKMGSKLDAYIQVIGEKTEMGVNHFWPILIKQQIIEGVFKISCVILLFSLGIYLIKLFKQMNFQDARGNATIRFPVTVFGAIFVLVSILVFCGSGWSAQIFNPEYAAFNSLINAIK